MSSEPTLMEKVTEGLLSLPLLLLLCTVALCVGIVLGAPFIITSPIWIWDKKSRYKVRKFFTEPLKDSSRIGL